MTSTNYNSKRLIVGAARFFSTVLSPLLMPSYGLFLILWGSFLSAQPAGQRIAVLLIVFGITCILPMFFISLLHNLKVIRDKRLNSASERFWPYLLGLLCYIGACFYLGHIHAPRWVIAFAAGGALACVVSFVVNLWWKISAHMAGICGVVALVYTMHTQVLEAFNLKWVFVGTLLLAGILGTSRIILKHHTFAQVLAGAINGYLSVKLLMILFG